MTIRLAPTAETNMVTESIDWGVLTYVANGAAPTRVIFSGWIVGQAWATEVFEDAKRRHPDSQVFLVSKISEWRQTSEPDWRRPTPLGK
jgi:transposase